MNILYIAYSCDPISGSENKIGWKIPLKSAESGNNVYVITKVESEKVIEEHVKGQMPPNMTVYYVDIKQIYKKIFKGCFYSGRLNVWNKEAFRVAREICSEKSIDVIHQITPVEFRSIGSYGKIENIKFVVGPIGGGEFVPRSLRTYVRKKSIIIEAIRMVINHFSRLYLLFSKKLEYCNYILFANHETRDFLLSKQLLHIQNCVYTELGIDDVVKKSARVQSEEMITCSVLVAGRLNYRKGHEFLFDTLEKMPSELDYKCMIVGDGPEKNRLEKRCSKSKQLQDYVCFEGKITHDEMLKKYQEADVLVMPSIRETTGSVLLEAMSREIPVITLDKFGAKIIVDNDTGWKYQGDNQKTIMNNLRYILINCISNRQLLFEKGCVAGIKAKEYLWETKIEKYNEIYKNLVGRDM